MMGVPAKTHKVANGLLASSDVAVKNTFLAVHDEPYEVPHMERRSSSAPPACRRRGSEGLKEDCGDVEGDLDDWGSGASSVATTAATPASIVSGASAQSFGCSEDEEKKYWADENEEDDDFIRSKEERRKKKEEEDEDEALADCWASPASRGTLNTQAAYWIPAGATAMAAPGYVPVKIPVAALPSMMASMAAAKPPLWVRKEFAEVIAAVKATLERGGLNDEDADGGCAASEVRVAESGGSWSVTGYFTQDNFTQAGRALMLAQQAMLEAAGDSSSVYVLGYETQAFTLNRLGNGFIGSLAFVQDEKAVCWDLLSRGSCFRGCNCRWQHPEWRPTVEVVAIVKASA